jgi:hypothetical protein
MRAARSKALAPNWPTFAPPQWPNFTPPLTPRLIAASFVGSASRCVAAISDGFNHDHRKICRCKVIFCKPYQTASNPASLPDWVDRDDHNLSHAIFWM